MLKTSGKSIDGLKVSVSGSGNVAQYATQKVIEMGGKVLTLSDSSGFIVDEEVLPRKNSLTYLNLKMNGAAGSKNTLRNTRPRNIMKAPVSGMFR